MNIVTATPDHLEASTQCLIRSFASDPVTGHFFVSALDRRQELLSVFFSLLLRARLRLNMPVLLALDDDRVLGVAMGYSTDRPEWPSDLAGSWDQMERSVPGMTGRLADYDAVTQQGKPKTPHYYLGVIGVDPAFQGSGVGARLLQAFCFRSAADPRSGGVYLETATPANVPFYTRAGFVERHRGACGDNTLWCMYLSHHGRDT